MYSPPGLEAQSPVSFVARALLLALARGGGVASCFFVAQFLQSRLVSLLYRTIGHHAEFPVQLAGFGHVCSALLTNWLEHRGPFWDAASPRYAFCQTSAVLDGRASSLNFKLLLVYFGGRRNVFLARYPHSCRKWTHRVCRIANQDDPAVLAGPCAKLRDVQKILYIARPGSQAQSILQSRLRFRKLLLDIFNIVQLVPGAVFSVVFLDAKKRGCRTTVDQLQPLFDSDQPRIRFCSGKFPNPCAA